MNILEMLTGYTPPRAPNMTYADAMQSQQTPAVAQQPIPMPQAQAPAAAPAPDSPSMVESFMAKLPGAQYMTPEERQGAIGLALLRAGSAGLQASQGGVGRPQPTLGASLGALAGGLGEGISGMTDQALKGAAIQAQMMGRQKSVLEAQALARKMAAQQKFAAGDRSPEVLAELNTDKALDAIYEPQKQLGSKGMRFNPQTGQVEHLPGYTEAMTRETEAKAAGTWQPIVPGGALVKPPTPGASATTAPAVDPVKVRVLQNNPYAQAAARAAQQSGVDPALYLSMIDAESGWNPGAKSPKGAVGLAQLMPDTAKELGVNPNDPAQNVRGGATYMGSLMQRYQGDQTKALMAYNWGPGNVDAWVQKGANPADIPAETQAYVRKVTGQGIEPQGQGQAQAQGNYMRDASGRVVGILSPSSTAENTFDKTIGESLGKLFVTKQEAVAANRQGVSKMQAISNILDGIETGKGSEALLEGKRALKAVGVDFKALGLTDNVGELDAAKALANEMSLELRNPAGGAGMPGAMSDADRVFLQSMSGGLTMTPQGRQLLLDARKRIAERSNQEGKLLRDYARSHGGRLDSGVYDALEELAAKPMFDQGFVSRVQSAGGAAAPRTGQRGQTAPNRVMTWNPRTGRVE